MKSHATREVLVSVIDRKIRLTINGAPAETIEVHNGDTVRWSPKDPDSSLMLLFPLEDKPVEDPVHFEDLGEPISLQLEGLLDKHYRYSVIVFKDVPYTRSKLGERKVRKGDSPPIFTVKVVVKDPVVIIR